jgi:hypothetical protein
LINPGTVAAIAASLIAQGCDFRADSAIFDKDCQGHMVKTFVKLAWKIANETEIQSKNQGEHHAQPENHQGSHSKGPSGSAAKHR